MPELPGCAADVPDLKAPSRWSSWPTVSESKALFSAEPPFASNAEQSPLLRHMPQAILLLKYTDNARLVDVYAVIRSHTYSAGHMT